MHRHAAECDKPQRGAARQPHAARARDSVPLPTSLDAPETTPQISIDQTRSERAAHARWRYERERIIEACWTSGDGELQETACKLGRCCRHPQVLLTTAGEVKLSQQRCRVRVCPLCSTLRARECADRCLAYLRAMDSPRFLTLTAPPLEFPLREHLTELRRAFERLRRTKQWREHVTGAIYTIEITRGANGRRWHPHIHVIIDGRFWPQPSIVAAWRRALNHKQSPWTLGPDDTVIVDIRAVHSDREATKYLAKYATKPTEIASWSKEAIREYVLATKGLHLIQRIGSMHALKVELEEDESEHEPAEVSIPLEQLCIEADAGSQEALDIIHWLALQHRWVIYCIEPELRRPPPDDESGRRQCEERAVAALRVIAACL